MEHYDKTVPPGVTFRGFACSVAFQQNDITQLEYIWGVFGEVGGKKLSKLSVLTEVVRDA